MTGGRSSPARVIRLTLAPVFVILVATLAVSQVRGWDGTTNGDGVSYLDLAAQYARGEWSAIANGYWSPLYPMLIGGARRLDALLPGGPHDEMVVVFGVNVLLLVAATLALLRLGQRLLAMAPTADARWRPAPAAVTGLRVAAIMALALWSMVRLIGATIITPDALLAAILFLVAGEVADAAQSPPGARRDVRLGVLLAAGCWTKAVFLPVSVVAIAAYALAMGRPERRRALPRVLGLTLALMAPLVVAQSRSQGRLSLGETGRLNYRWYVGGADHARAMPEPPAVTRRRTAPAVVTLPGVRGGLLFTGAAAGSFPYWYDPSRFEPAGIGPLSLGAQVRAIRFNLPWFREAAGALFLCAIVAMGAAAYRGRPCWRRLWFVAPALASLALYVMTHPEGRMAGASLACVLVAMLTLFAPVERGERRIATLAECIALGALIVVALDRTSERVPGARTNALAEAPALARAMRAAGLSAGMRVGVVGLPFGARWAHETGTHVVAVIAPSRGTAVVTDSTLGEAVRESAERGVPLGAIAWPMEAGVASTRAVPVGAGWFVWRP